MSKRFAKKLAALASLFFCVALMSITACSRSTPDTRIDARPALKGSDAPADKAEEIALAGEKLVYGSGIVEAAALFDVALSYDSKNVRARFYRALLDAPLAAKGILTRVLPIVRRLDSETQAKYAQMVAQIPDGSMKKFLLDGKEDITNEAQVQAFVSELQHRLRGFRDTLRGLNQSTLVLHAVVVTHPENCFVESYGDGQYQLHRCDHSEDRDFTLDFTDFEMLRLGVMAAQVYYTTWNAYDMTGLENVLRALQGQGGLNDHMIVQVVNREAALGRLIDPQPLKDVLSLGADGLEALRNAINDSDRICPGGLPNPANRPGHLVSEGVCPDEGTVASIPYIEAMLRGPVALAFSSYKNVNRTYCYDSEYNPTTGQYECRYWYSYEARELVGRYTTFVDVTKFFGGSATDLKTLLPNQFSQCGAATALPDTTLAGLFPRSDFVRAVRTNNPDFLNGQCVPFRVNKTEVRFK